jgi:integrase
VTKSSLCWEASRWYAVNYEGTDPLTGRDRRRWNPAADEKTARTLAAALPAARTRSSVLHGMTLARFMRTRWLPACDGRLRPTTSFRYRQMTERYVLPHLGRVPLRRLTIVHLERLYAELRTRGHQDGEPLAPKTVLNVHQVLRTALSDAERKGLVSRNVAGFIDPPCHGVAPEQRCWDDAQLRALLDVAADHRLGPALWLTAMTGMRRGEVLGLRWSDIDLDAERLSVQRSATCIGYQVHTTPTKTRTSRRPVDLDQRTVGVLTEWRAVQAAELGGDGRAGIVLTRANGQPVHPARAVPDLRASAGEGRVTADPTARSPSHARHAALEGRRTPGSDAPGTSQRSVGSAGAIAGGGDADASDPCRFTNVSSGVFTQ